MLQYRMMNLKTRPQSTSLSLLLRHTNSPSSATGCLGVLTANAQSPEVAQATVGPHLLQSLQVVTQLRVNLIGEHLRVLAIHNVALPVEEPYGDFVLCWVLDDGDDALEFFWGEFTGTFVQVHVSLLADQVGISTTDTLDLGQSVHDLLLAIDVCVKKTQDELKVRFVSRNQRHLGGESVEITSNSFLR